MVNICSICNEPSRAKFLTHEDEEARERKEGRGRRRRKEGRKRKKKKEKNVRRATVEKLMGKTDGQEENKIRRTFYVSSTDRQTAAS